MSLLITGGAGFIGTNFIRNYLSVKNQRIINLDKLTYSSNIRNLKKFSRNKNYFFFKGDIGDKKLISKILKKFKIRQVINFAAETHVDRSIHDPNIFIQTNILSSFNFISSIKDYWDQLDKKEKLLFRLLHVSTDEVYGTLQAGQKSFTEKSRYEPNSPYSASKASGDHLIRAWNKTYNIPTIIINCSNNYGPYQYPEKLIPLVISNALSGKKIPIYGNGKNIRDWIFVEDHCEALKIILKKGKVGETYNIGGDNQISNIKLVSKICEILDKLVPRKNKSSYKTLISFVRDRPGHDFKYAINSGKIKKKLNWKPKEDLKSGLIKTINWYLNNKKWLNVVQNKNYKEWLKINYKKILS